MISKNKFRKGIVLKPDADALENIEGELKVDSADSKIKVTLNGSAREVLTNSQSATLTNKSIDADNNTISNLEVDNLKAGVLDTDLSSVSALDDTLPSAKAVKSYVDLKVGEKDQASEISYDPTSSGLLATNVQAAIDEIDVDVDDLNTLSGVAKNSINLGTFTGVTIPDNQNTKQALQALETAHEAHLNDTVDAHDASAISNIPAGTISSTDVQAAINELDGDIQGHINDTVDAHDASAISVVPSGNLSSTDVQSALVELQGDINGKVSGPVSSTDNAVARFDGTTGAVIQNSLVTIDDAGVASGFTQLNVDNLRLDGNVVSAQIGNVDLIAGMSAAVNIFSDAYLSEKVGYALSLDSTSGSSATLATPTTKLVRLTNSGLVSISQIPAPTNSQEIILENATGANITINDNTGATAVNRILTGTKAPITLKDEASIPLIYDTVEERWMVAAGTGSGGSQGLDTIFQLSGEELLSTWVSGNNASFLGGGTLAGTFVYDTSTPLNGTSSYLYTQAAGSLNDYIASPIQSVPLRFRGNVSTGTFVYTYNGNSTDIEPIIYCTTTLAKLTTTTDRLPSTGTNASIYRVNVLIPSTCAGIRVGFQVKVLNSGKVLEFDDVELSADTTKYTDLLSKRVVVRGTGNAGQTLTADVTPVPFTEVEDTDAAWDGSTFTAPVSGDYLVVGKTNVTSASTYYPQMWVNRGSGYVIEDSVGDTSINGVSKNFQTVVKLKAGNSFQLRLTSTHTLQNLASFHYISITKIPESAPGIVTASESFSSDTASLTYAGSGTYTLSTLANAPVGTFITFTYAANTNTRTQTTVAPTQTTSDMNVNGIQMRVRSGDSAGAGASIPSAVAIQIGKGLKGFSTDLYKNTGKSVQGTMEYVARSATSESGFSIVSYNENTGILYLDAGLYQTTSISNNKFLVFSDITTYGSDITGYVVINASKSPALVGVPQVLPRIATLSDVKASGTAGGTATAGAYQTRTLNTLVDNSGIVTSLTANQFTLPAGEYFIEASAPAYIVAGHKCKLRNITDSTDQLIGTAEVNTTSTSVQTRSVINGTIIISSSKVFELQHRVETTSPNTSGYGRACSFGDSEVYSIVKITKVK